MIKGMIFNRKACPHPGTAAALARTDAGPLNNIKKDSINPALYF
jgi:hypothetical protein